MVFLAAGCSPSPVVVASARFAAFDVFVDSGEQALGAWQFEWSAGGGVHVVGVEGGDGVFAKAPYHDPATLESGHVTVAAFAVDGALPRGVCRVATMHVAIDDGATAAPAVILTACANGAGETVSGRITWKEKENR